MLPKYLSSDNDPLFLFHRWKANLRIIEIEEIKSAPGIPTSHPFIERVVGTARRECIDHTLVLNAQDLQRKLDHFQSYYNEHRVHSSTDRKTPKEMADEVDIDKKVVSIDNYRWRSHCNGLFKLPIAA